MMRIIVGLVIGATLGTLMGHFGQCSTGACPLTATWWRGAIYGAVMGVLVASSLPSSGTTTP